MERRFPINPNYGCPAKDTDNSEVENDLTNITQEIAKKMRKYILIGIVILSVVGIVIMDTSRRICIC